MNLTTKAIAIFPPASLAAVLSVFVLSQPIASMMESVGKQKGREERKRQNPCPFLQFLSFSYQLVTVRQNKTNIESSRRGTTVFRLRHNPCQGFPVRVSVGVSRALLLPLPSSNRTCGFPASGSRIDSRRRGLSSSCASVQRASTPCRLK